MNKNDLKVGVFLVVRYIKRANKSTTILILFVMLLTFLNLVVIGGLLEGLIVGSLEGTREKALGDVYISSKDGKSYINRSSLIESTLRNSSQVKAFSKRHSVGATLIPNSEFRNILNDNLERESLGTQLIGVNPVDENAVTKIKSSIIEGSFLSPDDRNGIVLGHGLFSRYSPFGDSVFTDLYPGDFVWVSFNTGNFKEVSRERDFLITKDTENNFKKYKLVGVYKTKAGEFDLSGMINIKEVTSRLNIPGGNVDAIAVRLNDSVSPSQFKTSLVEKGLLKYAKIETVEEALGSYLNDIRITFRTLGTVVGGIGVIVATITIFIIIFVTAASRQRYIGILKGIGVNANAIIISYVLYGMFFAFFGMLIGVVLLEFLIQPYFDRNPINFPFSDGILYTTNLGVFIKIMIIFIATLFAGYIPSKHITKKKTVDAIMNR